MCLKTVSTVVYLYNTAELTCWSGNTFTEGWQTVKTFFNHKTNLYVTKKKKYLHTITTTKKLPP